MKGFLPCGLCVLVLSAVAFSHISGADVLARMEQQGISRPLSISLPMLPEDASAEALRIERGSLAGSDVWLRAKCGKGSMCRPFLFCAHYATAEESGRAWQQIGSQRSQMQPTVLRAGEKTNLVIKRGAGSAVIPVRSLENGRVGQTIRVRDGEKHIYRGVVRRRERVEAE